MFSATVMPYTHPEHAAFRSKATAFERPRRILMSEAWHGMVASGVMVMQMSKSMLSGSTWPRFQEEASMEPPSIPKAAEHAADARSVLDSEMAMRRSWMPVRFTIHSSLVSTSFARSSLLTESFGSALPHPITVQPTYASFTHRSRMVVLCSMRAMPTMR